MVIAESADDLSLSLSLPSYHGIDICTCLSSGFLLVACLSMVLLVVISCH